MVLVLRGRVGAVSDLVAIARRRIAKHARNVSELLDELRGPALTAQTRHVLPDEDLGIARRARADTDRRDVQCLGDLRRDLGRHDLEHDREGTRVLQRLGVRGQSVRTLGPAPLHPVAAPSAQ